MKKPIFKLMFLLFIPTALQGQSADSTSGSINVFLNCNDYCYQDFMRTQITWVNFVQDQFVADVNLIITSLGTGSGGSSYMLYFNGKNQFESMVATLTCTTNAINTEAEVREILAQKIKLGLVRYAAKAGVADQLLISSTNVQDMQDVGIGSNPSVDPYNAWVFRISANGNVDLQKVQQSISINENLSASQVKEKFKLYLSISSDYSEQSFNIESTPKSILVNFTEDHLG